MSPSDLHPQRERMSTSCTVNKDAHDRCLKLLHAPTLEGLGILLQAYKVPVFDQVSATSLKVANGEDSKWNLLVMCFDDFEVNSPDHLAEWFLVRLCDEGRPYTSTRTVTVRVHFSSDISARKYTINHASDRRSCIIVKPGENDKLLIWGLLSICPDALLMYTNKYRSCPDRNANGGAPHTHSHPLTPHQLKLLLSLALLQHTQDVERVVEVHLIRLCHSTFQRLTLTLPPSFFLSRSNDREAAESSPHQRLEYTPWFQFAVEAERCVGIECLPSAIKEDSAPESPALSPLPLDTRKRASSAEVTQAI